MSSMPLFSRWPQAMVSFGADLFWLFADLMCRTSQFRNNDEVYNVASDTTGCLRVGSGMCMRHANNNAC